MKIATFYSILIIGRVGFEWVVIVVVFRIGLVIGCCAFVVLYDEKMVYRYNTVYPYYYWQCKKIK
jgi:hypothetical protein